MADDAVDLYRVNQTTIEGRCPELLQNLLEVRGIGLLDIRAIFGETAVRRKMRLRLIVHLVRRETMEREYERLPYEPLTQDVLGVPVRKAVIPVVAGRNMAVLVEAAVRNTILQLRAWTPTRSSSSGTAARWKRVRRLAVSARAEPRARIWARLTYQAVAGVTAARPILGLVRAVRLGAVRVQAQRVVGDLEALELGHVVLPLLDLRVVELLHPPAVQAHQVVVVLAFVEFVHRLAALEVAAAEDAGLLELREHAVHVARPMSERSSSSTRNTSSAVMCRCVPLWKTSRIFSRGSVALSPVLLSSSMLAMVLPLQ